MAKRSRRRAARAARARREKSFNDAQKTVSSYARKGGKQVNTAVTTFLSKFDTAQLIDALKKKTGMSGAPPRAAGASARSRSTARGRRRVTSRKMSKRAAAARAKATAKALPPPLIRRRLRHIDTMRGGHAAPHVFVRVRRCD